MQCNNVFHLDEQCTAFFNLTNTTNHFIILQTFYFIYCTVVVSLQPAELASQKWLVVTSSKKWPVIKSCLQRRSVRTIGLSLFTFLGSQQAGPWWPNTNYLPLLSGWLHVAKRFWWTVVNVVKLLLVLHPWPPPAKSAAHNLPLIPQVLTKGTLILGFA